MSEAISPIPEMPSPPPPPPRKKRARVPDKKRKRAHDLEQRLRFLQDEFAESELYEILQAAITAAHRLAQSTRNADRDLVLFAIERQICHTMEEICEETGLSRWVVQDILNQFIGLQLVEVRKQFDPKDDGGQPLLLYMLRHTPAGNAY
jgi:hypothetical protein